MPAKTVSGGPSSHTGDAPVREQRRHPVEVAGVESLGVRVDQVLDLAGAVTHVGSGVLVEPKWAVPT